MGFMWGKYRGVKKTIEYLKSIGRL